MSGNEWFLTTITVEPGQIEVYVNGQWINTYPITLTPQFQINRLPRGNRGQRCQTSFFTGSIADFAVYNSFLSACAESLPCITQAWDRFPATCRPTAPCRWARACWIWAA